MIDIKNLEKVVIKNPLLAWKFHLNILSSNIDSEYFIGSIIDKYGHKEWYKEGKLHRDNGPAVENSDGSKNWYIKGIKYTKEEFNKKIDYNL